MDILNKDGNIHGRGTTANNKDKPEAKKAIKTEPIIILKPRNHARAVSADEFIHNRNAAMKKLQSSKYAFKYNFGGMSMCLS